MWVEKIWRKIFFQVLQLGVLAKKYSLWFV